MFDISKLKQNQFQFQRCEVLYVWLYPEEVTVTVCQAHITQVLTKTLNSHLQLIWWLPYLELLSCGQCKHQFSPTCRIFTTWQCLHGTGNHFTYRIATLGQCKQRVGFLCCCRITANLHCTQSTGLVCNCMITAIWQYKHSTGLICTSRIAARIISKGQHIPAFTWVHHTKYGTMCYPC